MILGDCDLHGCTLFAFEQDIILNDVTQFFLSRWLNRKFGSLSYCFVEISDDLSWISVELEYVEWGINSYNWFRNFIDGLLDDYWFFLHEVYHYWPLIDDCDFVVYFCWNNDEFADCVFFRDILNLKFWYFRSILLLYRYDRFLSGQLCLMITNDLIDD